MSHNKHLNTEGSGLWPAPAYGVARIASGRPGRCWPTVGGPGVSDRPQNPAESTLALGDSLADADRGLVSAPAQEQPVTVARNCETCDHPMSSHEPRNGGSFCTSCQEYCYLPSRR